MTSELCYHGQKLPYSSFKEGGSYGYEFHVTHNEEHLCIDVRSEIVGVENITTGKYKITNIHPTRIFGSKESLGENDLIRLLDILMRTGMEGKEIIIDSQKYPLMKNES